MKLWQGPEFLKWAQSNSLWYYVVNSGCCGDEFLEVVGCRYDLERFGCLKQDNPSQADLLIICGAVTYKASAEVKEIYSKMRRPKFVLAIGACACQGGLYSKDYSYSVVPGAQELVPVDVYVPGCPPRPEAIMNGLLALQEKIRGFEINPN